jgi:hypothetical protein
MKGSIGAIKIAPMTASQQDAVSIHPCRAPACAGFSFVDMVPPIFLGLLITLMPYPGLSRGVLAPRHPVPAADGMPSAGVGVRKNPVSSAHRCALHRAWDDANDGMASA